MPSSAFDSLTGTKTVHLPSPVLGANGPTAVCPRPSDLDDGDPPVFPAVGDAIAGFDLVAELGRGVQGRVFLATEPGLADRRVVLKITPRDGQEHLSLARLQHTHIMPLYAVHDDAPARLRVLCMPYLGGVSLSALHELVRDTPISERSGRRLFAEMDRLQRGLPPPQAAPSVARRLLADLSYSDAVCWIGACLADALHYAHERGLVHLDVKTANVLLAADGQPLLLDFHLAHPPILPDGPRPGWLGGTLACMPVEQHAALEAIRTGQPIRRPVDRRADIYALGALLYSLLGGRLPFLPGISPPLAALDANLSPALSDLIGRCLEYESAARYADAAAVAEDLRRHLQALPLVGVSNRSVTERWRKWRRRRPAGLAAAAMLLAVLLAVAGVAASAATQRHGRIEHARSALEEGQAFAAREQYDEALQSYHRGLGDIDQVWSSGDLPDRLHQGLAAACTGQKAAESRQFQQQFHQLVDQLRALSAVEHLPDAVFRKVDQQAAVVWKRRARVLERLQQATDANQELAKSDLREFAMLWLALREHRPGRPGRRSPAAQEAGLTVIAQTRELCGASAITWYAEARQCRALGQARRAEEPWRQFTLAAPRSGRECAVLGCMLLQDGELDQAEGYLSRAIVLRPSDPWPHFFRGLCALRQGKPLDAVAAFSVCIGSAQAHAGCFHNRGRAFEALDRPDHALADYDRALELEPALGPAALHRGLLHFRAGRPQAARADLERAYDLGMTPAASAYHLALCHGDLGDLHQTHRWLEVALGHEPTLRDALELKRTLDVPRPK